MSVPKNEAIDIMNKVLSAHLHAAQGNDRKPLLDANHCSLDAANNTMTSAAVVGTELDDDDHGDVALNLKSVAQAINTIDVNASENTNVDFPSGIRFPIWGDVEVEVPSSVRDGFVRKGAKEAKNDPFQTTPSKRGKASSPTGFSSSSTPTSQRLNSRTSKNWRSGGSSSDDEAQSGKGKQVMMSPGDVSNANAQALYPPSACVFVANLAQGEAEDQLEYAVTKAFRHFGTVWVKIRRDTKNMPFAFCQYTCDDDAKRALRDGPGLVLHGRRCRVEPAKAHRTFLLSRRYGGDITVPEAREALRDCGPIERAWLPSNTDIEMYRLPRGAFVTFLMYEAGRDAVTSFRENSEFKLEVVNMMCSPRSVKPRSAAEKHVAQSYLDKYEVDRRSIFVGSLPQEFTERQVNDLFCHYGPIIDIQLHRRDSVREGVQWNVFAFVEFHDHLAVQRAIAAKHNFLLDGSYLKVTNKNSDHNREDRSRVSMEYECKPSNYRSPRQFGRRSPVSPQYAAGSYGMMPNYPPTPIYGGGYATYSPAQYYPGMTGYSPNNWSDSPGYVTRPAGPDDAVVSARSAPYYQGFPYSPAPSPSDYYGQMAAAHAAQMAQYQQYYPAPQFNYRMQYPEQQVADMNAVGDSVATPGPAGYVDCTTVAEADGTAQ